PVSANGLAPGAEPTLQEVSAFAQGDRRAPHTEFAAPAAQPVLIELPSQKAPEQPKPTVSDLFSTTQPPVYDLYNPPSNVQLSPLLAVPEPKRPSGPRPAPPVIEPRELPPAHPTIEMPLTAPSATLETPVAVEARPTAPVVRAARAPNPNEPPTVGAVAL